ncbi:MAG: four helix bundle protein [Bacteroidota bacterium]
MATVQCFQDLRAWQLARELNRRVYSLSADGPFGRDFALRDQIRKASISVSSNVAEGFERRSPGDFARFLIIAKASAAEVLSQFYLALDLGYITDDDFADVHEHLDQTLKALGGLIRYLRSERGSTAREPDSLYDLNSEP